jgi:hypothetical protein
MGSKKTYSTDDTLNIATIQVLMNGVLVKIAKFRPLCKININTLFQNMFL